MFEKVNVMGIVCDHFATFRNYATGRRRLLDYMLFLGVPTVVACLWVVFGDQTQWFIDFVGFLTMWSIMLVMVMSVIDGTTPEPNDDSPRKETIRQHLLVETASNTCFAALLSMVLLLAAMASESGSWVVWDIIAYWLATMLFLTLLMVMRRIYSLLTRGRKT